MTDDELKEEAAHIGDKVRAILQKRVSVAGAEVLSMTLNELNYAPEIASGMLKKQQAEALIEARELLVAGAVDISLAAVEKLQSAGAMEISNAEKVRIVGNLLTVTVGDDKAAPVVNVSAT